MALEKYSLKRNLQHTPEPPPHVKKNAGPLTFVVQKHHAHQLHYDFRLELDGVLKSWSVPKGPSLNPEEKHLAVMVEDHPLEYASFEGIIPKGEYGGGEVIIWDSGTYSPGEGEKLLFDDRTAAEEQVRDGLEKGKLSFELRGQKLKGSWALVKMQKTENNWLLIKHRDEYANSANILQEEKSVVTGRTVEDVKAGQLPKVSTAIKLNPKDTPGARKSPFPSVIAPMLASLAKHPFSHPDWIFEPKLDGYRVIAQIRNHNTTLFSRNGNNVTTNYATLLSDLNRQPASELILDGEIIALDEKGKQCFQCLQNYLKSMRRPESQPTHPLVYYIFDILYLDGYDLRGIPLNYRKKLLDRVLSPTNLIRLTDYFEKDGEVVYEAAVKNGLEGVIAKKNDSLYESGKRSLNWLKFKSTLSDEFLIGGYNTGEGGREKTFGSLLLGYYNDKGKLMFAGHVGTGFDEETLGDMKRRLESLRMNRSPFSEAPDLNAPTNWVKPELVAEVKFSEWTQDGRLRAPVFLRLRDDKAPKEVRRMEPVNISLQPQGKQPAAKNELDAVLEQLENPKDAFNIEVEGNSIPLTSLLKIFWPAASRRKGLTKNDFLTYLVRVSPYLLPHLKDRPLTLSRYPDGINGEHFFQKHWASTTPGFIEKVMITEKTGRREYLICNNLSTLLWLGQIADMEFHTWYSRINPAPDMDKGLDVDKLLDYPDFIVFDLDPYIYSGKESQGDEPELNRRGFTKVSEAALWLKEILDKLGLISFVKTSGKTGIHVYVPILRRLDYKTVRTAAATIGKYLVNEHPDAITIEWSQEKRKGKVFFDYGQNVRGKTLASIYSPRPTPDASVSTPLRWDELGKVYPTDFTITNLPDRLVETGDIWADILTSKQDLGKKLGIK